MEPLAIFLRVLLLFLSQGGRIKVNNLDTVLGSLGIELTDKEHESLTENLPLTGECRVPQWMSLSGECCV